MPTRNKQQAAKQQRAWQKAHPGYGAEMARRWREKNREYSRELVKRNHREIKAAFLEAYGGVCACCGEAEKAFLTCEHQLGNGGKMRKQLGGDMAVLRDLRDRGWPKDEGITILCWNCNSATRYGRTCPHKMNASGAS